MDISCVWEHNGNDTFLYCVDFPGSYTRGASFPEAAGKISMELSGYCLWAGVVIPKDGEVVVIQDASCDLKVSDADSEVLFETEKMPLSLDAYQKLKSLALKSAKDFQTLYDSIPDQKMLLSPQRQTFYGAVPSSAEEMYLHTKNVNAYYFGEIGINADNEGDIYSCRVRGFEKLEAEPDFLEYPVMEGSYGELWSLRKMLRRFIWHDRIHARAMYRRSKAAFPDSDIANVFFF